MPPMMRQQSVRPARARIGDRPGLAGCHGRPAVIMLLALVACGSSGATPPRPRLSRPRQAASTRLRELPVSASG